MKDINELGCWRSERSLLRTDRTMELKGWKLGDV